MRHRGHRHPLQHRDLIFSQGGFSSHGCDGTADQHSDPGADLRPDLLRRVYHLFHSGLSGSGGGWHVSPGGRCHGGADDQGRRSLADPARLPDSGRSGGTFHRSGPREAEGAEPAGGHHHHDRPVLCEPADRRVQPDHRPGYGHHFHLCPGDGPVWGSLPLRAEADCVPALVIVIKLLLDAYFHTEVPACCCGLWATTPPW